MSTDAVAEIDEISVEASHQKPPREVCGFLVGRIRGHQYQVLFGLAVMNSAPIGESNRYEIDSQGYLEAERLLQMRGLSIIGIFHSHPGSDAQPSRLDREYFFPGWVYLIVGLETGGVPEHRAFLRLADDPATIVEVAVDPYATTDPSN
jgi:proteasome lid subunit RPN8/RPN11